MTTPLPPTPEELLSALADGQATEAELHQALAACEQDPAQLARWRDYQRIGQVLRGLPVGAGGDELDFLDRLRPALAPLPAAGRAFKAPAQTLPAANEPRFRWPWVAGLAGVAVAAGLGWGMWQEQEPSDFALGEAQVQVVGPQGVMLRDAALEELMEAHRDQGAASVLPVPSGFLRNATFDASPEPAVPARPGR